MMIATGDFFKVFRVDTMNVVHQQKVEENDPILNFGMSKNMNNIGYGLASGKFLVKSLKSDKQDEELEEDDGMDIPEFLKNGLGIV